MTAVASEEIDRSVSHHVMLAYAVAHAETYTCSDICIDMLYVMI